RTAAWTVHLVWTAGRPAGSPRRRAGRVGGGRGPAEPRTPGRTRKVNSFGAAHRHERYAGAVTVTGAGDPRRSPASGAGNRNRGRRTGRAGPRARPATGPRSRRRPGRTSRR